MGTFLTREKGFSPGDKVQIYESFKRLDGVKLLSVWFTGYEKKLNLSLCALRDLDQKQSLSFPTCHGQGLTQVFKSWAQHPNAS